MLPLRNDEDHKQFNIKKMQSIIAGQQITNEYLTKYASAFEILAFEVHISKIVQR